MIRNTKELRVELSNTIEMLKKDSRFVPQAKEINNACGKMISSARFELEYFHARKEQPPKDHFLRP